MNLDLLFEIIQIALNVTQASTTGTVQNDIKIADALLLIAQKVDQAIAQNAGMPIDPNSIREEGPIN